MTDKVNIVTLVPLTKRAKERVEQHGDRMKLVKTMLGNILVESLNPTWRGQNWLGWFSDSEVKVIHE